MGIFVTTVMSEKMRSEIRDKEIWHYSKATPEILTISRLPGRAGEPNAIVHLRPPKREGWDFWRNVRDLSVVFAPAPVNPNDDGRYLYCFLEKPGIFAKVANVQGAPLAVRIRGSDLLANVLRSNLFWRQDVGTTIVIRGDYIGPARLDPA